MATLLEMLGRSAARGDTDHAVADVTVDAGAPDAARRTEGPAPRGAPRPSPARQRGGLAIALSGGAARGWAHIGVMRAFEEASIPIAGIAGTSIGALVGGCFLAGQLDSLEAFARSITRRNMVRYMDFSWRGAGLIGGERLATHLHQHLGSRLIEDLPAPFVAVCTDIATGHEIWLHDGPLIQSLRASYALPGVFEPIRHNGRTLVDGALVNPVPVSAARSMEPDLLIAVDLNHEAFGRGTVIRASHYNRAPEEPATAEPRRSRRWLSLLPAAPGPQPTLPPRTLRNPRVAPKSNLGVMGVMMEAFNIIQDRIARARMAGDPPDYTLRPRLAGFSLADFHRADELIDIGYEEASTRLAELVRQGALEPL